MNNESARTRAFHDWMKIKVFLFYYESVQLDLDFAIAFAIARNCRLRFSSSIPNVYLSIYIYSFLHRLVSDRSKEQNILPNCFKNVVFFFYYGRSFEVKLFNIFHYFDILRFFFFRDLSLE